MLVDHLQPLLGNGGGTMHHQVGVGDGFVDLGNTADGQNLTGGLAGELVGAVAGADSDRQRVAFGFGDEISGFSRIGEEHVHGQLTFETMAVLGLTFAGLK
ncbi:MAG: Uncharacterised protein [Synechococcus sp. CC9902]|nr:MAG: Uncharacterised protein [Synechococcus sp. CC9902]